MKREFYTTAAFLTLALSILNGCAALFSTNGGSPANSNSDSDKTNSNTSAVKKQGESNVPAEKLKNLRKPENEKAKSAKNIEVPKNWITVYDEKKGYSFSLPDGSSGNHDTQRRLYLVIGKKARMKIFIRALF